MQELSCLNSESFGEIRILSKKYFNMLSYMIRLKILVQIGRRETGRCFLMSCLLPFLKIGSMFPFFQSSGNIPHFKQFSNVLKRGSIIATPDIFKMRILIISWPWALLGSSLQIIRLMSFLVNSMFTRYWYLMGIDDEGRTLLIIEHCFSKKRIKEIGFY